MKIKVKYNIPVATWIKGETEIESDKYFDQMHFHEKVNIMKQIAEDLGEIPASVESAFEVGYADLQEVSGEQE